MEKLARANKPSIQSGTYMNTEEQSWQDIEIFGKNANDLEEKLNDPHFVSTTLDRSSPRIA